MGLWWGLWRMGLLWANKIGPSAAHAHLAHSIPLLKFFFFLLFSKTSLAFLGIVVGALAFLFQGLQCVQNLFRFLSIDLAAKMCCCLFLKKKLPFHEYPSILLF